MIEVFSGAWVPYRGEVAQATEAPINTLLLSETTPSSDTLPALAGIVLDRFSNLLKLEYSYVVYSMRADIPDTVMNRRPDRFLSGNGVGPAIGRLPRLLHGVRRSEEGVRVFGVLLLSRQSLLESIPVTLGDSGFMIVLSAQPPADLKNLPIFSSGWSSSEFWPDLSLLNELCSANCLCITANRDIQESITDVCFYLAFKQMELAVDRCLLDDPLSDHLAPFHKRTN